MPRKLRDYADDVLLHAIGRGVEKRKIFLENEDCAVFMALAKDVFQRMAISLINFCLMPNHFHFELGTADVPIGKAMHWLQGCYSMRFNEKYGRVGHLFQDRYHSFEVKDDAYCLQLATYISRNPPRAGLVSNVDAWEWSGHAELVSGRQRYLNLSRLGDLTGHSPGEFRERYIDRMREAQPEPGPIRSIQELIRAAAERTGLSSVDILDGYRGPFFTRAKRLVVEAALRHGSSMQDIAEALKCTPGALSAIRAAGLPKGDKPL